VTLNGRLSSCSGLKTLIITSCIYRLQQLNHTHLENEEGVSISLRKVNTRVQVESDLPPRGRESTLRIALFWVITQRVVVVPYGRFGKTYRSSIQGS
jgi:hypothetical protein